MALIRKHTLIAMAAILLIACAAANEPIKRTPHTYHLGEHATSPKAELADVSWLVGSWVGSAFGGNFEEVWNPPSAGSMVGFFKFISDEDVNFYELMLLVEEQQSLVLKVKHFNADFSAWEEKGDFVSFPLVQIDHDAIHFSGLSFYRQKNGDILGYIVMVNKDQIKEHILEYQRVKE